MNRWLFFFTLAVSCCQASTVYSYTAGTALAAPKYWGQSFTTPNGGPWDDLTANLYNGPDNNTIAPAAAGTGFLLTQQYTGTPADLSSSTPGFLAASTCISSDEYVFASSVELLPDTVYYFYENAPLNIAGSTSLSGPPTYVAVSSTSSYTSFGATADFTVNGDVSGVPEPLTAMLFLAGGCSLTIARRWVRVNKNETRGVKV